MLVELSWPFCRPAAKIRYEHGACYCKSITVHWTILLALDSSRVTYFTQFAASVGCQEYLLVVCRQQQDKTRTFWTTRGFVGSTPGGFLAQPKAVGLGCFYGC